MSDSASFRRELEEVRAALASLTIQVDRLFERLDEADFEVVNGGSSATSGPTSTAGSRGTGASNYTQQEREAAARDTGAFFVRALSGEPRGSSGRGRIRLQNRIYVVIRSYTGEVFTDPVGVYHNYSRVKELVCHPSAEIFGDSIFCGFPSQWEARLAVSAAGFRWP